MTSMDPSSRRSGWLLAAIVVASSLLQVSIPVGAGTPKNRGLGSIQPTQPKTALNASPSGINLFRAQELGRIIGANAPPVHLRWGSNTTTSHAGVSLRAVGLNFTSVNWRGHAPAELWIEGRVLVPENLTDPVPAVVAMHGLNGRLGGLEYQWAKEIASTGRVAFTYSHPGHGQSEGPHPCEDNFATGNFSGAEHFYLLVAASIRAVQVVRNLSFVDPGAVFLMGGSYGGLTTLVASSILYDQVRGGIAVVAVGDLPASFQAQGRVARWVFGAWEDITDTWANMSTLADPISYLRDPRAPPQLFLLGTNDDYFSLASARHTLAVMGERATVVFNPNGHHTFGLDPTGFPDTVHWPTTKAWLDEILAGGTNLGTIALETRPVSCWWGLSQEVEAHLAGVGAAGSIERVTLFFRRADLPGEPWRPVPMENVAGEATAPDPGNQTWRARLPATLASTKVECYVQAFCRAGPAAGDLARVSSSIAETRQVNYFTVGLVAVLLVLLALPVIYVTRKHYFPPVDLVALEGRGQGVPGCPVPNPERPGSVPVVAVVGLLAANGVLLASCWLNYVEFDGDVGWTAWFVFGHFFTVTGANLTIVFLALMYWLSLLPFSRPLLSGTVNVTLSAGIVALYLFFTRTRDFSQFGPITFGPGFWLFVVSAVLQLAVGIFLRITREGKSKPRVAA